MPTPPVIRARFPALDKDTVYLDNAGGSQLPDVALAALNEFLVSGFVSSGAGYAASLRAWATIRRAHEVVKFYLNAAGPGPDGGAVGAGLGEVLLGSSSTALCHTLANAFGDARRAGTLGDRNEIIIGTFGHEANVGPWMRLKDQGFTIREWPVEMGTDGVLRPSLATLENLLNERTLLTAFPQVSNLLGEIYDAAEITRICHAAGSQVMVDGVAFAPHHAPDVAAYGCDWYVYSTYKVFGPHMAALYGRREALDRLTGPNHYFIPRHAPGKWELGGCSSEGCSMITALWPYACFMADTPDAAHEPLNHAVFRNAFATMASLEEHLMRRVLEFLATRSNVRVLGPPIVDSQRVCIASFIRRGVPSASIAETLQAQGLGVRSGSFYSPRLCAQAGIDPVDGVVRISLAHYNNDADVDALLTALDRLL